MKALLFGASGQVGRELKIELSTRYDVLAITHDMFDLTNTKEIDSYLTSHNPGLIINAAAYTNVEVAERQVNIANQINHLAPREIAKYCTKTRTPFIHISTDYVFDGKKINPYIEADLTNPLNQYGQTKLDGEKAIINETLGSNTPFKGWAIFRTSWIYGNNDRPNFMNTIRKLSKEHTELRIINDQFGCPTWSRSVAIAIMQYIVIKMVTKGGLTAAPPIYNMCCSGSCSWYEFAKEIVDLEGLSVEVVPISSDQFPTEATRPKNSVLDCSLLRRHMSIQLPNWQDALRMCLGK